MLDQNWRARAESPEDVVARVKNGHKVFVHGASATPVTTIDALCGREDLRDVELYHLHVLGDCRFAAPDNAGRFFSN